MSGWALVLWASGVCFALKLAGYLVPTRLVDRPGVARAAGLVTVALLAALVAVQTFATGRALAVDARAAALVVAAAALALRAPFLLVVVLGAGTAALLRWAGAP